MSGGDALCLNADGLPISILPLSSLIWQDAIKSTYINSVRVLASYEDWVVHSPSMQMQVPSVVMISHYIKPGRGVRFAAENIFLRDRYHCQYCGGKFTEHELTLDHVQPVTFGGRSTWENLTSACSPCNNKRGCDFRIKPKIPPYRPTIYEMVERRREFPIEVPHHSWVEYLMWPEDKITVVPKRRGKSKSASFSLDQLQAA